LKNPNAAIHSFLNIAIITENLSVLVRDPQNENMIQLIGNLENMYPKNRLHDLNRVAIDAITFDYPPFTYSTKDGGYNGIEVLIYFDY
jgi:hypothetical protein